MERPGPQESPHTNRLAAEDSPYLLQHAHNPVDWLPWGEDAFAQARQRGVPLFVSSGYSACYWCHVMERESFEDPAVAAFLNEHFVPVKVDREQRPDVDAVLMAACQAYTAATEGRPSGGWPLTVFLEPTSLRPFLAGTYFPKVPSHGRISFIQLLERIHQAWTSNRAGLEEQARRLGAAVEAELTERAAPVAVTRATIDSAAEGLLRYADRDHGGFGGAPKFPQPAYLEFLAAWQAKGPARDHVDFTLERMALGGVADQLGGGFHRYAVDGTWTVPHFEKMLYDQAQLLPLYAEAAARTSSPFLRATAEGIVRALHREFERPDGLFDAAMDAEVDGQEGGSFLWSPDEARSVLQAASVEPSAIDATLRALGLDGPPNFRDPHHPEAPPAWVLTMRSPDEAVDPEILRARDILLHSRDARKQPRRDDKAILGWNGLVIAGLAEAGAALHRPEWVDMAARAALACQETFRTASGAWLHAKRTRVDLPATLEDLACFIRGLHALALATGDRGWAARALVVADDARAAFFDPDTGQWYESSIGRDDLFVRPAGMHDGAVPSGPGEMLAQLPWLEQVDPSGTWKDVADASFRAASGAIASSPTATCRGLVGYLASGRLGEADALASPRRIGPESPVEISLVGTSVHVRMPEGWKIVARAGGPTAQTLTGLAIRSRTQGIRASWTLPALTEAADGSTYLSGSFSIPITLSGPASESGARVDLDVTWQACNATACLLPESRTLTLTIP